MTTLSHVYSFLEALEGVSKEKYEKTYGIKQLQDGVRVSPSRFTLFTLRMNLIFSTQLNFVTEHQVSW